MSNQSSNEVERIVDGFDYKRTVGRDPNHPRYTGSDFWESGRFTVEARCVGGMSAHIDYYLFDGDKEIAYAYKGPASLRKWLLEHVGNAINKETTA